MGLNVLLCIPPTPRLLRMLHLSTKEGGGARAMRQTPQEIPQRASISRSEGSLPTPQKWVGGGAGRGGEGLPAMIGLFHQFDCSASVGPLPTVGAQKRRASHAHRPTLLFQSALPPSKSSLSLPSHIRFGAFTLVWAMDSFTCIGKNIPSSP